jgi:hypothetical protein
MKILGLFEKFYTEMDAKWSFWLKPDIRIFGAAFLFQIYSAGLSQISKW